MEMKLIPDSKIVDPNESSLLKIHKEQSFFFQDFSETKRKSIENDNEKENTKLRNEISSIKKENIEMKNLIKTYEKKVSDLELEIENLKIWNLLQGKENKEFLRINCEKTMNNNEDVKTFLEDKINSLQEIKIEEKSSKNVNSIITKKFKGYFEDNKEIFEDNSKKDNKIFIESEIKKENLMKFWDHQENNLKLDFPHLTIFNIKKSDNNFMKKNGVVTIEQQILNTTKDPIIIEFYEIDFTEGILKSFDMIFYFLDLTIYNKNEKFVAFILEPQTFMKQTYYLKKFPKPKDNPSYNFILKLQYK